MKDEGKTLDQLLKAESESNEVREPAEKPTGRKATQKIITKPLNVDVPDSLMRDLKVISAHNDVTIKDMVVAELTKLVKREKKKLIDDLNQ